MVENNKGAKILLSSSDFTGVHKVASWLQNDINNLANLKPEIVFDKFGKDDQIIIIGTLNKNKFIDKLIENGKISLNELENKWEKFLIKTIENPFPNISKALVIVGSDKRGTIYGILDLAENIGVSPWYWWADVAFKKKQNIYVKDGTYTNGEPKVKYRGIFINDEAPALSGWAAEKFGTDKFNHKFYEHVFELILRLKGNFLWPAMWGRAFYEDDPENPKLADELGIVISTSHHEPMMRAHAEWQKYGTGPWNYEKNENELKEFWRDGIKRMGNNESVITLAMRGDGDEAMSDDANVSLLEKIVSEQRKIIEEVTKKDATEIPQVWALYKEVQEYYDKGMRVPDDVTILLCDDNWGNLRKLPMINQKPRKGGYGIYYHFDYVGGPRNYKWLNTTQIERVWEQMNLAYNYGADKIWVVNVGDIKPMEFPISFFLEYAWNPEKITADNINCFYAKWAKEQFGLKHQLEIAEILKKYTKYNSRRKPELLSPETYSLTNYREFETVVNESKLIEKNAKEIYNDIPDENKDAFYQLVLHPVEACANLHNLYYTVAKNNMYAEQERILTNKLADEAKELFDRDKEITDYYHQLVDGKWNHMMDQTHIGYTYWQQPDSNSMPEVEYIDNDQEAEIGIMVEGSEKYYPDNSDTLMLPIFDKYNNQSYFIEIFNRGKNPFNYIIDENIDWINLSSVSGEIKTEGKIFVNIDWQKSPIGKNSKTIIIDANGEQ
ncbi:MAG: glycosyl hydrolase 115 family protein, partial [Ignavibacteriae bacterium]|nr:glycosyl hydrolase 115 family protein [Ignavibacteriota bacterium]